MHAALSSPRSAFPGSSSDELALELGDAADYGEYKSAAQRRGVSPRIVISANSDSRMRRGGTTQRLARRLDASCAMLHRKLYNFTLSRVGDPFKHRVLALRQGNTIHPFAQEFRVRRC